MTYPCLYSIDYGANCTFSNTNRPGVNVEDQIVYIIHVYKKQYEYINDTFFESMENIDFV